MFAIIKGKAGRGLEIAEVQPGLAPGYGEVEVRVSKAGICGTDLHIYQWDDWSAARVRPPTVVGHEFVGRIERIGPGVTHLHQGQRVSVECHVTCGVCRQCRTGAAHLCAKTSIIGVDRDGCFAEHVVVPALNVWPVPDTIPDRHAAIFDPCGNAMHTVTAVPIAGRDVLVTGAGTIGLIGAAIAKAHGARVVIVQEPSQYRAALAREVGADLVVDPRRDDAAEQILEATNGEGPQSVLEMSGNGNALRSALQVAANGAHVSLLGIPPAAVSLDLGALVIMKGLTLHGITGRRMFETWYDVAAFMQSHPSLLDRVITHELPADKFAEGFSMMEDGACGKVILDFAGTA